MRSRPPRPLRRAAAAGLVAALSLAAAGGASAQVGEGGGDRAPAPGVDLSFVVGVLPEDRLDRRLASVAVEGAGIRESELAYRSALVELAETAQRITGLEADLVDLVAQRSVHLRLLDVARAERTEATVDLRVAEQAIRRSLVDAYMSGSGPADELLAGIDPARATNALGVGELVDSSSRALLERRSLLQGRIEDAATRVGRAERRLTALALRTFETRRSAEAARLRGAELLASLPALTDEYLRARLTATVVGIDVPLLALDAYLKAADRLAADAPGCGVTWWHLAGVGRVESNHGRFGGRALQADGTSSSPIVGVALDGQIILGNGEGVALIPDSDGGAIDGDPVYDRAVGPMQFIPSTWARWGTDGNGDGVVDPQNVYDAAAAAARYLCAVSGDLRSEEGTRRALFGYNRSPAYVQQVYELAVGFSRFAIPG
jgi:hypothetical protein